ncbi:MAG TPA: DUF3103 family protein [Sphingobacteriaceae bacterium]
MKRILLTIGTVSVLLLSCQKDTNSPQQPEKVELSSKVAISENKKKIDDGLDLIAKNLAASFSKKELRHFVKKQALKKFDGDFDILYKDIKSVQINGKSFQDHLVGSNGASESDEAVFNQLKEIGSNLPLLNISVPVNIEKWDPDHFTPLVAIRSSDYNEKTTKKIKAYDKNGIVHWLDAKKDPEFPVVAVSLNERTFVTLAGKVELKKGFEPGAITPPLTGAGKQNG